jgi:hypothetical protein
MRGLEIVVSAGLAIYLATAHAAAAGNDHSANYYLPSCSSYVNKEFSEAPFLQGKCVGIIEGLAVMASDLAPGFVVSRSCVPDDVTLGQMTAVVVQWLDQHPQQWHRDFRALVLHALHDAWPCQFDVLAAPSQAGAFSMPCDSQNPQNHS